MGEYRFYKKYGLNYIIFNDLWDTVVENSVNQSMEPVDDKLEVSLYLKYLTKSLKNVLETHDPINIRISIWLIEISTRGLTERDLYNYLIQHIDLCYFEIFFVPCIRINKIIEKSMRIPKDLYRSPNELHEFLLLLIIRNAPTDYLMISDPDIIFIEKDAIFKIIEKMSRFPQKWIAGFVEKGVQRPYGNAYLKMRERLHSVALFIDKAKFTQGFTDGSEWQIDILKKVEKIKNKECVDYYTKYKVFDTLSVFTDYLKYNFGGSRLLELNEILSFKETSKLTMLSDYFVHCKYLREGIGPLHESIETYKLSPEKIEIINNVIESK